MLFSVFMLTFRFPKYKSHFGFTFPCPFPLMSPKITNFLEKTKVYVKPFCNECRWNVLSTLKIAINTSTHKGTIFLFLFFSFPHKAKIKQKNKQTMHTQFTQAKTKNLFLMTFSGMLEIFCYNIERGLETDQLHGPLLHCSAGISHTA